MKSWQTVNQINTPGPGFFMRSHEKTPCAWVAAHTGFTRDGKYALVSIWENDGALVVYDSHALKEVKRLPVKKPSGKYNIHNKITRSAGTSR